MMDLAGFTLISMFCCVIFRYFFCCLFASSYCREKEFLKIIGLMQDESAKVLFILLEECTWRYNFKKYNIEDGLIFRSKDTNDHIISSF